MTTTSTETRRLTRYAAQPAYRREWTARAACNGEDLDDFFSESTRAQNRARVHCRVCPVLATCMDEITSLEDSHRYGVYAGLNSDQRRALPWEVALHGQPSIPVAQDLVDEFADLLGDLRHDTPEHAAEVLAGLAMDVDSVTARLAMWWLGYKGARMPRRTAFEPVDQEPQRIIRLHANTIRQLRSMGASYPDVASYLGVAQMHITKAITVIEQADDAALRAQMELEAAA